MAEINFADLIEETKLHLADQQVEFKLLDEGEYDVTIAEANVKTSAAGNNYIALTLEVDGSGRKLWYNLNFVGSEKSIGFTLRTLKGLGLDPEALVKAQADPASVLVGIRARAKVVQGSYVNSAGDKVDKNEVRYLNPIPGVDYSDGEQRIASGGSKPPASPF